MKSDLDQIIEYFESEKQLLELSIKENLAEYDYLYAHYQQEGLWRLNSHLNTLKQFRDPLFNKKRDIESSIEWMSRFENTDSGRFYKRNIAERKLALEKLSRDRVIEYFNDSQVIDEALFDLYERRIRKFRLCLNEEDNFNIDFEITGELLRITHQPDFESSNYDYAIHFGDDDDDAYRHPLEKLAFEWSADNKVLVYHYDIKEFREALPVKILLSRIIYEKFNFGQGYRDLNSSISTFYK